MRAEFRPALGALSDTEPEAGRNTTWIGRTIGENVNCITAPPFRLSFLQEGGSFAVLYRPPLPPTDVPLHKRERYAGDNDPRKKNAEV